MSKENPPLFILQGNGACVNRGCEAILRGTIAILEREFGASNFLNAATGMASRFDSSIVRHPRLKHSNKRWSPTWTRRQLRKFIMRRREFPFEPYLRKADAVLALGGDRFSLDYCVPTKQLRAAELTVDAGKTMVIWGASVGPFDSDPRFEKLAMEKLRRITLICARESCTRDYLARHGVINNVQLVADPAFVMEPEKPQLDDNVERMLQQGCLGVNLSPLLAGYLEDPNVWAEKATHCVEAIDCKVNVPILLIPHVIFPVSNDYTFLSLVRNRLKRPRNPIHLLGPDYNSPQTKWIISQTIAFVGARTHSTIASLSSHVPTLSIGYSVKARGINQDIFNHENWLIPMKDLTPQTLADAVEHLMHHSGSVREELKTKMPAYKQKAWRAGKHVHEAMERMNAAQISG